ncbi:hypothetical protein UlMin_011331 [Ulmus minor]
MELLRLHKALFKLLQILLLSSLVLCDLTSLNESLDLSHLPSDFLFGTASSSYQYEGAYLTDGKGLNNWDVYTHRSGNKILDGSSGDVAVDHYHLYLEDINLMSSLGVNSYRFSISRTRILPKGKFGEVNQAGIEFYNKLINALLHRFIYMSKLFFFCKIFKFLNYMPFPAGIEPFVTLNHFDFPHELEERYGGWLSSKSQEDFESFAEICFKSYGDRVKNWVTLNEPNLLVDITYRSGKYPPCRCSWPFGNCSAGDSEKEPLIAAHNLILSHAAAVSTYKTKYQKEHGGKIGIVVHIPWFEPISNSTADELAAERAQFFFTKWFLDPIIFGKYPADMEKTLGSLLPKFSTNDKEKLKMAGVDFIGINHHTSYYVQDCIYSPCEPGVGVTWSEGSYRLSSQRNGVPIGEPSSLDWLNVYPRGMEKTVEFVMETYNNIPMIITENGFGTFDNPNTTVEELLVDAKRLSYMADYLDALLRAMRFGLYYVDYGSLNKTRKSSATWYERLISRHKDNVLIFPKKDGTSVEM